MSLLERVILVAICVVGFLVPGLLCVLNPRRVQDSEQRLLSYYRRRGGFVPGLAIRERHVASRHYPLGLRIVGLVLIAAGLLAVFVIIFRPAK